MCRHDIPKNQHCPECKMFTLSMNQDHKVTVDVSCLFGVVGDQDAQVTRLDEQARSTCLLIPCHNSALTDGQFLCDALIGKLSIFSLVPFEYVLQT